MFLLSPINKKANITHERRSNVVYLHMEFSELIKLRQSVRKYSDRIVEREKIIVCLEAARLAPSANNSQPWKFIVVDDPQLKNRVAESAASFYLHWAGR